MPPIDRVVRWLAVDGFGAEHLRVRGDREGLTAESIVVGELGEVLYGLSYRLRCDSGWRFREAVFVLVGVRKERIKKARDEVEALLAA